jgi:hypothetical protein
MEQESAKASLEKRGGGEQDGIDKGQGQGQGYGVSGVLLWELWNLGSDWKFNR